MPKNNRYPSPVDPGYYYAFAGYVADLGRDLIGIRDAVTAILLDLELDPSSKEDRKWAVNKFRVANPNYYDPDNKKKQTSVNKNTTIITLFVPLLIPLNLLTMPCQIRIDRIWYLQQLIKELQLETIKANWEDVSDDVKAQLLIETIKTKFVSGDRKLEIANPSRLKLQERC